MGTDSDSTSSCSDVEPSVHIVEVTKSQCDGLAFVEEFTVDEPLDNEEEDEQNVIVDEPLDNDLEDCEENVIEVNHHESELEEKLEPDQEAMDHDNEIVEDNNDKQEQVEDQSLNNNIPDVQSNDLDLNNETENTNENTNQTSPAPPLISDE